MDNWTFPRLPESAAPRTFQTSRRGLALPRQRLKGRRRRRDFGTASTRWRKPRGGGMRSGKPSGGPNFKPLKPRGRKIGRPDLPAWCRGIGGAFGQSQGRYQAQADEIRSRNRRAARDRSSRSIPAPDGTGTGASAGRQEASSSPARVFEQASDAGRKALFGAHRR